MTPFAPRSRAALLLLPALTTCTGAPATAQPDCAPRDQMAATLTERYGESLQGLGLAGPAHVIELHVAPDTGSFSLLVTGADGTACLVAAGLHWQHIAPVPAASRAAHSGG